MERKTNIQERDREKKEKEEKPEISAILLSNCLNEHPVNLTVKLMIKSFDFK